MFEEGYLTEMIEEYIEEGYFHEIMGLYLMAKIFPPVIVVTYIIDCILIYCENKDRKVICTGVGFGCTDKSGHVDPEDRP